MTARQRATKRTVPEQVTLKRKRHYRLPDGVTYPSVTTALSVALNKPALPGWAAKVVAETAIDNLPRLVREARVDKAAAISWLKGRPYAQRDDAAAAGTKAHEIAEAHVLGQPYAIPDPDSPLGLTLANFLRFIEDFEPEFEATEATVVNHTIGWAGTLDAIARIPALDNRLVVIDHKTSKSGPYPEWALQVAGAYAHAEQMWLKDGTCIDMPSIEGALVLRLRPDFYALHEITGDFAKLQSVFAHVVELATWALDAEDDSPFSPKLTPSQKDVA